MPSPESRARRPPQPSSEGTASSRTLTERKSAIDKTNKFTKLQIQSMFGINPRALARALENNLKGSHKGDPENDDNLLSEEFKVALATRKFTVIKNFVRAGWYPVGRSITGPYSSDILVSFAPLKPLTHSKGLWSNARPEPSAKTTGGGSLAPAALDTGSAAPSVPSTTANVDEPPTRNVPNPSKFSPLTERNQSINPTSSRSSSRLQSQAASGPASGSTHHIKPDPDQMSCPVPSIVPQPEPRDSTPEIEELPAPSNANANASSIRTFLSTLQPPLTQYTATFEKLGVRNAEDLLILKGLSPASVREFLQEVRKDTDMTFLQSLA
ncbi:hypothetical protein FRB90_009063 [Tulasnella sp. 427]|nr:hypothetical protein FRB90_009063 [Tulasnella sp. 427]